MFPPSCRWTPYRDLSGITTCARGQKKHDGKTAMSQAQKDYPAVILVVDDDPGFLRACTRILQVWKHEVVQAATVDDALRLVRERDFDVILSDINMPGANGIEFLRAVRVHDKDVPVILMTGGPELETARLAVECGAQSYLIKPLASPQLKEAIDRHLEAHREVRRQRKILAVSEKQAHDTEVLRENFGRALSKMWMAFQPIVCWSTKSVVAYEALLRTTDTTLCVPTEILAVAEKLGEVHTLGHRTRGLIAEVMAEHPELPGVFVNLHVLDLLDEQLYAPDSPLLPFAARIHFEITERMAIEQVPDLHERVERLRKLGYKIAVDDLGEGYSGLNSFAKLEPDAVKLDMSLIRGIEKEPTKRRVVRALASLCRELGTPLVAEGVETQAELDTLLELGADWLQGFLFARPAYPLPVPRI
jgi:EAL domain-containing protein (putative c-di-GMP-specific phosphodiesterase class I)